MCLPLSLTSRTPTRSSSSAWLAIVPHNAIADSLMEKISQFVESASEAEVWEETWEIR